MTSIATSVKITAIKALRAHFPGIDLVLAKQVVESPTLAHAQDILTRHEYVSPAFIERASTYLNDTGCRLPEALAYAASQEQDAYYLRKAAPELLVLCRDILDWLTNGDTEHEEVALINRLIWTIANAETGAKTP